MNPDKEVLRILERQFEDNREALEMRLEQERQKVIAQKVRRVNRSINRLEKQNNQFLDQISKFRQQRKSTDKISTSMIRDLSDAQTKMLASSQIEQSRHKLAEISAEHDLGDI